MKRIISILCAFLMTTLFLSESFAQDRSFGATFSYAGTGLEYVHFADSRHFAQYQIRMETTNAKIA
jgi:hypothetical protein